MKWCILTTMCNVGVSGGEEEGWGVGQTRNSRNTTELSQARHKNAGNKL